MNCTAARDTMTLALYGEASGTDARAVVAHLTGCRPCVLEAGRLAHAARALAFAEGRPIPAELPIPATVPGRRRTLVRALYAAAAALALVTGGLALRSRLIGGSPTHEGSRSATVSPPATTRPSPYLSEATVDAEITALDQAVSSLESNSAEL